MWYIVSVRPHFPASRCHSNTIEQDIGNLCRWYIKPWLYTVIALQVSKRNSLDSLNLSIRLKTEKLDWIKVYFRGEFRFYKQITFRKIRKCTLFREWQKILIQFYKGLQWDFFLPFPNVWKISTNLLAKRWYTIMCTSKEVRVTSRYFNSCVEKKRE